MAINYISFTLEKGQVYAQVSQSAAERTTLQIPNRDETIHYSKVVTEKMQTINLTPYLRSEFEYSAHKKGDIMVNGNGILPVIKVNGYPYMARTGYWGQYSNDKGICSDLPYRLIAEGQSDVISVMLEPDGSCPEIGAMNATSTTSLFAKSVKPTGDIEVTVYDNDGIEAESQRIRYVFRPMGLNGVRIAWINKYGALDFWNFDHLREENIAVQTEKIYTKDGYVPIYMEREKQITIATKELPKAALEALSYILASPAVWLVNDTKSGELKQSDFTPIDIITDNCRVYSDSELSALQITYRAKQRERW